MSDKTQVLAEIVGLLSNNDNVHEMHLRWAANQPEFGFSWVPTQQELRTKLVELGHLSD